jgi:hypothetical protein
MLFILWGSGNFRLLRLSFVFVVLGTESRVLYVQGKYSPTELPLFTFETVSHYVA